jgi:hypothetical protein
VRWVEWLPVIIDFHNRQPAFKTSFRRNQVTSENFLAFLSEKHGVGDATMQFNTRQIDIRSINPVEWKLKLFKFQLGARVLITRASNSNKPDSWLKKTTKGTFEEAVHTIVRASLRSAQQIRYLVPGESKSITKKT